MARKLKTFVTTGGFYELAVAAPSMKAAAALLGVKENAFAQGFAHQSEDVSIIDAVMDKPGVVLRRAVGTKGAFEETAELPKLSTLQAALNRKHPEPPVRKAKSGPKAKGGKKPDADAQRKAAQLYDLAERRRERDEARAEVQRAKERERRERAMDKAQRALDEARAAHNERIGDIRKQREALQRKESIENQRWDEDEATLKDALRDAQGE